MGSTPMKCGPPQDTPQVAVKPIELLGLQLTDPAVGAYAGLEADFIRVVVADSGDRLLIQEKALDGGAGVSLGKRLETLKSQVVAQRVYTKAVQRPLLVELASRDGLDRTLGARRRETELSTSRKLEPHPRTIGRGRGLGLETQETVIPHVEHEAVVGTEAKDDVATVAFDRIYRVVLKMILDDTGLGRNDIRVVNPNH